MARQTILSALELTGNDDEFLFPSPSVKETPITAHALAVAMARFADSLDPIAGRSWRAEPPSPHDLRRTLAIRLAELGFAKEDRDAVLNHTARDAGEKHYDLYDREREKRRALELWASALTAINEGRKSSADLVPLNMARRDRKTGAHTANSGGKSKTSALHRPTSRRQKVAQGWPAWSVLGSFRAPGSRDAPLDSAVASERLEA
jgi:hypothetical protein